MTKFRFLLMFIITLSIYTVAFSQNYWVKTNGPFGANVKSFAYTGNGELLLGTFGDGVYKLSATHDSWSPLNNGLTDTSKISSILPESSGALFLTTSDQGIFKSTNNGALWQSSNNGLNGYLNFNCIAEHNSGALIAGTVDKAIYKSINKGSSWSNFNTGLSPSECVNVLVTDNTGNIFIGTKSGVFLSTDIGQTWVKKSTGLNKEVLSLLKVSNTIYAGSIDGFFISTDNGNSWQERSIGLSNKIIHSLTLRPNGELIAGTEGGIFKSISNVTSWSDNSNGIDAKSINVVLCNSDDDVFAGSNFACYFNSSKVKTWNVLNNGLGRRTVFALSSINSKGKVFAGTDLGIYQTTNNGESWSQINNGLGNILKVLSIAVSQSKIFAGTSGDGLYQSTDQGGSWSKVVDQSSVFTASTINTLDTNSSGALVAGTMNQGVYQSDNNGVNWYKHNGLTSNTIISLAIKSNGDMYAGTDIDGLYRRSVILGNNWSKISVAPMGSSKNVPAIAIDDLGSTYACTNQGLYKGSPDASYWTKSDAGLQNSVVAIVIGNNGDIFSGLKTSKGVFQSTDKGSTWKDISDNTMGDFEVVSLDISGKGYIFAGTKNGGVYRSRRSTSSNVFNTEVKPEIKQILGYNDTIQFSLSIFNINDLPIPDAQIDVYDGINKKSSTIQASVQGKANFTLKIPNGVPETTYKISFVISKNGFEANDTIFRLIDVQKKKLNLTILPNVKKTLDWGGKVDYTITVADQNGIVVPGATVHAINNLDGSRKDDIITDALGVAHYIVTVPQSKVDGNYFVKFYTDFAGYESSDTLQRDITVEHNNIIVNGNYNTCTNKTEVYDTPLNPLFSFKWGVHGGVISGDSTKNTVTIIWGAVGAGEIELYQKVIASGSETERIIDVVINDLPVVTFNAVNNVCLNEPDFDILAGKPLGGIYSGPGIINGTKFRASSAGLGTHQLTYTYTDSNGCDKSAVQNITVIGIPTASFTLPAVNKKVCVNDIAFALSGGSPSGGYYAGNGVSSDQFDPTVAGVGIHTVRYVYQDVQGNGCADTAKQDIEVMDVPSSSFDLTKLIYCQYEPAFDLTGGGPGGGSYSGPGVSNNKFDPAVAGPGNHKVVYSTIPGGNGCSGKTTVTITVRQAPDKPTVTRNGNELVSSATSGNQWLKNGVVIPGATSQTYLPSTSTNYSVITTDANGCSSLPSDPFNYIAETTSCEIAIAGKNLVANSGEYINIPIGIKVPGNLANTGATDLKGYLKFNSSILEPLGEAIVKDYKYDGKLPITISLKDGIKDSILTIEFITSLGDSVGTFITIDSLYAYRGLDQLTSSITIIPGYFSLSDVCYSGGARLLTSSGQVSLMLVKPNPSYDNCQIDYETTEKGRTQVFIMNTNGQIVSTLVDGTVARGLKSLSVDIRSLPTGSYYVILQTPTKRRSVNLEVIR